MELNYRSGGQPALWKAGIKPVYLFTGEEDRLKNEAVSALIEHVLSPDLADFDLEALNTDSADASAVLASAGQAPFGPGRRVVVLRGAEAWRDRARQKEADRLAEGLSRIPESTCLLIVAAAEGEEGKRKTAISAKLDAAAKTYGALVTCSALKGEALTDWVVSRVAAEGKQITADAAARLVDMVGGEMRTLDHEIIKLVCYTGNRPEIRQKDVEAVAVEASDDTMFATIDAICRRQTDRSLVLFAELNRHDPKAQAVAARMLAMLARQYRLLWQAKFLSEMRVNARDVRSLPPQIAAELPGDSSIISMAFKAGELFTMAKGYSWNEIRWSMDQLLLCDLANKGGVTDESGVFSGDPAANLQTLILQLSGALRKAA